MRKFWNKMFLLSASLNWTFSSCQCTGLWAPLKDYSLPIVQNMALGPLPQIFGYLFFNYNYVDGGGGCWKGRLVAWGLAAEAANLNRLDMSAAYIRTNGYETLADGFTDRMGLENQHWYYVWKHYLCSVRRKQPDDMFRMNLRTLRIS